MASSGVVFPVSGGTDRSTSALGRAVVADALRAVDPIGARAAEHETNWRSDYLVHFRRLVEAGLSDGGAARRSAAAGLASLHDRMRVVYADGEVGLREAFAREPALGERLDTVPVAGDGEVERELSLPYRGERLRGDTLARQLDAWVAAGVIEPSCAEAVRAVASHPDWLDLSDLRVVALGAGAEMGPVHSLLRWGGDVVAVDLPRPGLWRNLLQTAGRYGGRLHVPVPAGKKDRADLAEVAGADLLHELPVVAQWLLGVEGRLVVGNYVYADGATNTRVCTAVDALTERLRAARADTALAFLATPTDVFAAPAEAVAQADAKYRQSSLLRTLRGPLRMVSAGRLLRRNYPPDADPGVCDSLVAQQGPNYALAKRLQRWRAAVAREQGATVSFKVAPPTRTRSVVKNRVLAAAYAGAPAFGVEVFEPATSNTLMAALLVHDLRNPPPVREHLWQEEATGAAHGGLWRMPYAPRSALGLAALLGFGGARN
ncbi:hypothetical protein [Catellatospora sp. NPDC049609]|uniref:hypothetical protein n=1 Tax=Catellatospora sp. NPDC049609 TaxID=3155505 RepID=UPI003425469B